MSGTQNNHHHLEYITIEPKQAADSCVIWLHGLGADGHDFANIVPDLGLPNHHRIRFLFPHAPYRPITINQHEKMRAWYDLYALDSLEQEDEAGLLSSCAALDHLIQQQKLNSRRLLLVGFSQGGALALFYGLTQKTRLAAVLGLSTYLPFLHHPAKRPILLHQDLPILMCHGSYDDIVPLGIAEETRDYLSSMSQNIEWKDYPIAHQVCDAEVRYIGQWLAQQLL